MAHIYMHCTLYEHHDATTTTTATVLALVVVTVIVFFFAKTCSRLCCYCRAAAANKSAKVKIIELNRRATETERNCSADNRFAAVRPPSTPPLLWM